MDIYISQGIKSFFTNNFFMVLNFLGTILIIRLLTPEIFGSFALAMALLGIIEIFTTFSFNIIYLQRNSSNHLISALLKLILLTIFLKILLAVILFLIMGSNYQEIIWQMFLMIFLIKLLVPLNSLGISMLEKKLFFFKTTLIVNLSNMLGIILALVSIYFFQYGIYGLLIREVVPVIFISIIMLFYLKGFKILIKKNSKKYLKLVFFKSLHLFGVRSSEIGFARLPIFIIDSYFGSAIVGYYTQSLYLVNILNRLLNNINQQLGIVFFSNYKNNIKKKRIGALLMNTISILLGLPFLLILFLYSNETLSFLWGNEWIEAETILRYLSPLIIIIPIFTILKSQLYGDRKNNEITIVYIIGTSIFLTGLYLFADRLEPNYLIPLFYFVSFIVMLFVSSIFLKRGTSKGT